MLQPIGNFERAEADVGLDLVMRDHVSRDVAVYRLLADRQDLGDIPRRKEFLARGELSEHVARLGNR